MNNHRKNGKPNPEQKYFLLAVKLLANTAVGPVLVQAFHSDRVIVRVNLKVHFVLNMIFNFFLISRLPIRASSNSQNQTEAGSARMER